MRTCAHCGAVLTAYQRKTKRFCSETCQTRRYRAKNREKVRGWARQWRANNPERVKEQRNASQKRCPRLEYYKKYRAERGEIVRAYKRKWASANPDKLLEKTRRRQTAQQHALPIWLTKDDIAAMRAVYRERKRISEQTGVPHEVDHIVPLQGKHVRGLHVPWNLQIIPATVNREKRNRA
jgi:predicted nucleic acid-binding Zn ribbon protein